ncbi:unnamed protein product [Protopolystoma xenopodis]|uniref:Uncharacterized protein n=1 Tax=Protopolystoma xenopodis TaxID=117903 RepID=A0A448XDC3_9PLAT|nr:unnamed protein product [Protopolystoma xenopodis]
MLHSVGLPIGMLPIMGLGRGERSQGADEEGRGNDRLCCGLTTVATCPKARIGMAHDGFPRPGCGFGPITCSLKCQAPTSVDGSGRKRCLYGLTRACTFRSASSQASRNHLLMTFPGFQRLSHQIALQSSGLQPHQTEAHTRLLVESLKDVAPATFLVFSFDPVLALEQAKIHAFPVSFTLSNNTRQSCRLDNLAVSQHFNTKSTWEFDERLGFEESITKLRLEYRSFRSKRRLAGRTHLTLKEEEC